MSQVNKASTVLEEGQGICRDYAYLVAALARSLDIPARVVYGSVVDRNNGWEPQLHAWNELQVDGRWVIVDATWDAGYIKNGKFVSSPSNKYFDPDNEEFAATHKDAKVTLH
ncbi:MAG: transglutaminase-like domain-containing protein [Bacillota bacterium]|nr:transglutaminase-like domain-containing protein [Bacillota bacterium]